MGLGGLGGQDRNDEVDALDGVGEVGGLAERRVDHIDVDARSDLDLADLDVGLRGPRDGAGGLVGGDGVAVGVHEVHGVRGKVDDLHYDAPL